MISIETKTNKTGQKIHYMANYVKEGFPVAIGKMISYDIHTHPLVVLRGLHHWLNELEQRLIEEELCLKNSQFGSL